MTTFNWMVNQLLICPSAAWCGQSERGRGRETERGEQGNEMEEGKKGRTERKGKWGEQRDGEGDVVHVYVGLCNMKQSALLYLKL